MQELALDGGVSVRDPRRNIDRPNFDANRLTCYSRSGLACAAETKKHITTGICFVTTCKLE